MKLIDIESKSDERGKLSFLENFGFEVKRIFWIKPSSGSRGNHANYECKQCMICLQGKCKVTLDDGSSKEEIVLDSNDKGLILEPSVWRTMSDFSSDCLLLVLASMEYYEKDYIRDYDKFKEVYVK